VPSPASVPSDAAGIPAYYVALTEYYSNPVFSLNSGKFCEPPIVVGESLSGRRLATVPPPAETGFTDVTGAFDDRWTAGSGAGCAGSGRWTCPARGRICWPTAG
jgi:hypothetical protein